MESARFSFLFKDLLPQIETVEKTIGYIPGESPQPVRDVIVNVLDAVTGLTNARAEYRILKKIELFPSEKALSLNGVRFDLKSIIYNQIKKSEAVALFLCTAGETISAMSRKCMKDNDLLTGYMYDVIGSAVVEAAADRMQDELRKIVEAEGKHITNRFSPGYCGWNVSEQHRLFTFFRSNHCGIVLTESALMSPVKSVSGIIGIGKDVKFSGYQCGMCEEKNCLYRNKK